METILNIHPKEIIAVEMYSYKAVVRKNDSLKISASPVAAVTTTLSYDGEKYFPMHVAQELKKKDLNELMIGTVALGEPKDWKGGWNQQIGAEMLDVKIPLRTMGVVEQQWTTDELEIQCSQEYYPESPRYFPIEIALHVLDRQAINPMFLLKEYFEQDGFWVMLAQAGSIVQLDSILSFELEVKINLPSILGGEELTVDLHKLFLSWLKIPPRTQFEIFQWDSEHTNLIPLDWEYEPDRKVIVLNNIAMNRIRRQKIGNPLTSYQTVIRVNLMYASGDLLREDQLEGKAIVRVNDRLLSGRDVAWMDASGRKANSSVKVDRHTLLAAEFEASLVDQFAVKRSFLSRRWIFPGVSLQDSRLSDVISVLLDMGYSNAETLDGGKGRIIGSRKLRRPDQEDSELFLWIQLTEKTPISTTRERKLADSETYRTAINTAELTIDLYAQMNGTGETLALDAENVMQRLKDQFTAVADLR